LRFLLMICCSNLNESSFLLLASIVGALLCAELGVRPLNLDTDLLSHKELIHYWEDFVPLNSCHSRPYTCTGSSIC
jgi:hypothetical protein